MLRLSAALFALLAVRRYRPAAHRRRDRADRPAGHQTLCRHGRALRRIAIVRNGQLVLTKAYGKANEGLPANPGLALSNRVKFQAVHCDGPAPAPGRGKLSLDDPVSKYIPGITEGNKITIRELISHTSGPARLLATGLHVLGHDGANDTAAHRRQMGEEAARFSTRGRWQYSNTGYVVAGMIAEKVSGEPLVTFLNQRIFGPLGMHPLDQDDTNTPAFPAGYHRFALGPVRVAQPPARGWLYAAGELSMTAADLARWDIARMDRTLIPAARLGRAGNTRRCGPTAGPTATALASSITTP